jgi:ubiquinone/menaquinone biosynthesis C-methylase UbiE
MTARTTNMWEQTNDVDYMGADGRDSRPSHGIGVELLTRLADGKPVDLLDCGVMSGVTYRHLRDAGLRMNYTGIDVGEAIIADCRARMPEARWARMNVMDMEFADNQFDIVNARHLLETLPYYETAVREMFRVARTHVLITFFMPPRSPERLVRRLGAEGHVWYNRYAPEPFTALLDKLSSSVEIIDVPDSRFPDRIYRCTKR